MYHETKAVEGKMVCIARLTCKYQKTSAAAIPLTSSRTRIAALFLSKERKTTSDEGFPADPASNTRSAAVARPAHAGRHTLVGGPRRGPAIEQGNPL